MRQPATLSSFIDLLRIPSLRIVTSFVAVSTFGLYLVYTWLPTFLYDKFNVGLARAGFEASVYPQIGTLVGLIAGGAVADRLYASVKAARFSVVLAGRVGGAWDLHVGFEWHAGRDSPGRNRVRCICRVHHRKPSSIRV